MMTDTQSAAQQKFTEVYRVIMAPWGSQVVRALSIFSVAEHLAEGPLSARQIAERESIDPKFTYRMLRAAASMGFVVYRADKQMFAAGVLLDILHEDSPNSLKYYAQACLGPAFWLPALRLPEAVAAGHHQTMEALGSNLFEYLGEQEEARRFSAAMTNISTPVIRKAVSVMNVHPASHVIDVGGADGAFVIELAARNERLTGDVVDLPHVVPGVVEEARKKGVADRVKGVSGDFFSSLPSGDIYLLKFILHDWDDESCVKILSNIQRAMNPGARLFIVEMVIDESGTDVGATMMDMGMLCCFTGQERSRAQFEALLGDAGLRFLGARSIGSPYQLIEAEADTTGTNLADLVGRMSGLSDIGTAPGIALDSTPMRSAMTRDSGWCGSSAGAAGRW
jgi:O-methyltransferase domain